LTTPGTRYLQAVYSGDANNTPVTSTCGSVTVIVGAVSTLTVNTTSDLLDTVGAPCALTTAGQCSFRQAIREANGMPAGSQPTIVVPAGTYNLTRPTAASRLVIASTVAAASYTIRGAGAGQTIVDAQAQYAVLENDAPASLNVSISGLTLRNGRGPSGGGL